MAELDRRKGKQAPDGNIIQARILFPLQSLLVKKPQRNSLRVILVEAESNLLFGLKSEGGASKHGSALTGWAHLPFMYACMYTIVYQLTSEQRKTPAYAAEGLLKIYVSLFLLYWAMSLYCDYNRALIRLSFIGLSSLNRVIKF